MTAAYSQANSKKRREKGALQPIDKSVRFLVSMVLWNKFYHCKRCALV